MEKKSVLHVLQGVVLCLIAVVLFSTAYIVFANETKNLAASVSFFWFSCFASLTSWIFFHPKQKWSSSIKQGGYGWLVMDIGLYFLSFYCTLSALKEQQAGVALTVIAVMILRAPMTTIFGYFVVGDACQKWSIYWIGTAFILIGLILYRLDVLQGWQATSTDTVTILSLGATILASVESTVRKRYRNAHQIDPANAVRSMFTAVIPLAFGWTIIDILSDSPVQFWPNTREWLSLAYLGIVPTGIANILFNKAEDRLSIPITQSINCLGPFFTLAVGLIPVPFFAMSQQHLVSRHYIGLSITVVGAIVVTAFAGTKRRFPDLRS
ncbi:MAG: DMT family transporter [Candidatus Uhrbacteria bacterium]